jgi:hypothetical protein
MRGDRARKKEENQLHASGKLTIGLFERAEVAQVLAAGLQLNAHVAHVLLLEI